MSHNIERIYTPPHPLRILAKLPSGPRSNYPKNTPAFTLYIIQLKAGANYSVVVNKVFRITPRTEITPRVRSSRMVKNSSSADERNRATMKCKRHVFARLKLTWCFFVRFRPCPKHLVSGSFLRTLVWWMARTCKRFCFPTLELCVHSARKVHEKFIIALLKF